VFFFFVKIQWSCNLFDKRHLSNFLFFFFFVSFFEEKKNAKKVFGNKKKKEQLKQKRALKQKMEGLDIEERQKFKQNEKKKNKQIQKQKNKKQIPIATITTTIEQISIKQRFCQNFKNSF
jgi:hypothetical protein